MIDEVGPAKLTYAVDEVPVPTPSYMPEIGPAKLRYALNDDEIIIQEPVSPTIEQTIDIQTRAVQNNKPEAKPTETVRKKPTTYYTIKSKMKQKKGRDIMAKKVTLKVEDLLRAGRSHFEIPKSKQEAMKAQKQAPKRRG